jgi:hypothetical protein
MFIFWNGENDRVYTIHYDGENYSEPYMIYNCFDYLMNFQFFYYCWSAVVDNDGRVFFADPIGVVQMWNSSTGEWENDRRLPGYKYAEALMGLSYDEVNDEAYLFTLNMSSQMVNYYSRGNGEWKKISEVANVTDYIVSGKSDEHVEEGTVALTWYEGDPEKSIVIKTIIVDIQETCNGNSSEIIEDNINHNETSDEPIYEEEGKTSYSLPLVAAGIIVIMALVIWQYSGRKT